jgi:hypothetical protein
LEPAAAEVQFGVDEDAVELGDVDYPCAEHRTVELEGFPCAGNGEERGEARRTVRYAVGRVLSGDSDFRHAAKHTACVGFAQDAIRFF